MNDSPPFYLTTELFHEHGDWKFYRVPDDHPHLYDAAPNGMKPVVFIGAWDTKNNVSATLPFDVRGLHGVLPAEVINYVKKLHTLLRP